MGEAEEVDYAAIWKEAFEAGCAPPVILEACNQRVLELISLEALQAHAL